MSYPWIARHTKSQQRLRPAPHQVARIKQLRVAMLLALSGGMLWSMRPVQAAEPLPVASVPVAGPTTNVANFGNATLATPNAATLQVNQTSDKAIIQWNSFNIDAGHTVNFSQPSTTAAVLNRVGGSDPSLIAGALKTSLGSDPSKVGGQIYLINTNGILFATGATVNVNTLTASTLDISDQLFKAGILSASTIPGLTPVFSGSGKEGDVTVAAGAALTAQSGGRIMLVAPNVHNQGIIKAPDGQIILAAGAKVYLQASKDPSLRGLLVEVDASNCPGCSNVAENLGAGTPGGTDIGQLMSQHGNITLVGLAVNQSGHVSATTSVNANGSIQLLAESDATYLAGSSNPVQVTRTGTVTIGANSVTEVTPDIADPTTAVDEQVVLPSKITAVGNTVDVQSNSRITAASGVVTLSATADPKNNLDPTTLLLRNGTAPDGSRVYVDQSAVIDVSGTKNVVLPMSHNLVQVQLRANELADSPLQRNGILYGQTVTVDARVGTPLANVSGAIAGIGHTIAERTTNGGTVNLQSTGDVVVNSGATLDVSGGSKQYQGGSLNTTKLLSNGVTYDIGNASPDRVYDGIAGLFIKTYARWGVTESWGIVGPAAGGTASYVPGYVEGADAGTVNINTFHVQQDGTLLGNVITGPYQRNVGAVNTALCNAQCQAATYVPQGGRLIIGDPTFADASSRPLARIGDVMFGNGFASPSLGIDANRLASTDPIPTTQLDTAFLTAGGFTNLAIYSQGLISLPQDASISTMPGGSVNLAGRQIDIAGTIHTPGGSVNLGTGYVANETAGSSHDLTLGPQARIDTAGLWVNDLPQGQTPAPLQPTAINGGSVTLNASGNLDLESGSLIDVSGGAWLNSSGKLHLGKGGNVTLATTQPDTTLSLGAKLRGYAPGAGGTLSIATGAVCISALTCDGQTNPLQLDPAFFQQGGFGNYVVTANMNGLTVASDATIAPLAQSLLMGNSYVLQSSGSDIYGFSTLATLPNGQRTPVNVTLNSTSTVATTLGPGSGALTVAAGARITGDTGAALSLKADRRIVVDGTLTALAGKISLSLVTPPQKLDKGFDPGQSIWLGADSALLAGGTTQLLPNAFGLRQGQVLAGGTVTLDAQRGYVIAQQGSRVDVSGTTGTLDLSQGNGSYLSTSVASGGGTVNISAAEGILWDGSLAAQPGATTVTGGTLNVTLTRANAGLNCQSNGNCDAFANAFPMTGRSIVLQSGASTLTDGLAPGDAIDLSRNGQALLGTALVNNSGFDNVALTSDRTIQFPDTAALKVNGTLRLDAPQIALADGADVNLDAAYIGLGASGTLYQAIGSAPTATAGSGTLTATASLIDLIGNVSLSGIQDTQLHSRGDLRLRGVRSNANQTALLGSLATLGNLSLQADQIYPTTFSNYTVNLLAEGSGLTVLPGDAPTAVLSAGGALTFNAPNITDQGVLKAPLGSITLNGSDTVQLADGSLTSTSAEGQIIPFGTVTSGSSWSYDFGGTEPVGITAPPAKAITLGGAEINVDSGATLNLSGGGDLLGYEWVPGPGGSSDVLLPANAPNSYAVLPGLSGGAFAPFDPLYYQGSTLQPGNSVYLSGGGGLAAGTYALLPARYALLPGAFLVTAVPGFQDLPPGGTSYSLLNGATVVPGYRTLADTGIRTDQRWSGFSIQPGPGTKPAIYASEYDISTANTLYTAVAAATATAVPRLPVDAGQLAINAGSALTLNGQLLGAPGALPATDGTTTQTGRGAQVDIVATNLDVVNSIDPNNSDVQLLASELNDFGAESLLLGALRSSASDGTLLSVGASTVTIGPDVELSGPELLLAAHDKVTVDSGAQLTTAGKLANTTPDTLIFGRNGNAGDGNGALLRLSVGPQTAILREHSDQTVGSLEVQSNSVLSTPGALALDATFSNQSFGTLAVSGSLSLGAPQINLGAVPANTQGLTLDNSQLASFTQLKQLVLRSYGSVDLYGSAVLGSLDVNSKPTLQNLSIEGAGLLGFKDAAGGDASASITAGTVSLGNPSKVTTQETANGSGSLQIHAVGAPGSGEIDLAAGDFAVTGFNNVTLTADSQSVAQGKGSLTVAGDLAMVAPRLTAQGGADYTIKAAGHTLSLAASGATPAGLAAAPNAGKLSLKAADVNLAGRIDLPAGILAVTADNGINLSGSINVAGMAQDFAGQTAYLPAGNVTLNTTSGDIAINAGTSINVAGTSTGGAAGQLNMSARQGEVLIDAAAQLSGKAADGYQGGGFTLDENTLADFSALNTLLNNSGFTRQRILDVHTGDVNVAAGDTVTAHDFQLTVDNGKLAVSGTIDASGNNGGQISLASSDTLSVLSGALLDAHATDALGDGGSVTLETGDSGTLNLAGGSIDVLPGYSTVTDKTDPQNPVTTVTATGKSGQIYLRAPRAGNDVAINPGGSLGTTFTTAAADKPFDIPYTDPNLGLQTHLVDITAEAYQHYDNKSTIDNTLINTIAADNSSYMSNAAVTTDRLGMTGNAQFHLTPGVEIRSTAAGDLTLANDWNLYQDNRPYNGGVAGVLTLRATGNLNLNNSLSDGFSSASASASQTGGSTWSYRLVGGADLASPDPLAVLPTAQLANGSGNVNIASGKLVRTGNGRIDVAAGNNITFGNKSSVLYTAGTQAALLNVFDVNKPDDFNYATAGGDITLSAQNDVIGAVTDQLFSEWLFRQGYVDSGDMTVLTSWGLSFANFRQNVGALGGGDITVKAGNDINNLSAVIPTTGYLGGDPDTPPDPGKLTVLGGGNLSVNAGGNVASGIFYVGRGSGQITAGGGLTSSPQRPLYTVLAAGEASFNVQARNDAILETVLNPTMLPLSTLQPNLSQRELANFFTYAPDSAVNVQSLAGNITFDNNTGNLYKSISTSSAFKGATDSIMAVYPGTLRATAFQGDIVSNRKMALYPAPLANLQLLAGGDVSMASINMSDADPNGLPQPLAPVVFIGNDTNLTQFPLGQLYANRTHSLVPVHDQPGNPDLQPALIVAGGNLTGQIFLPKSIQLSAGKDIKELNLIAQNLRSSDITSVIAGHNISYSSHDSAGRLFNNSNVIQVGGPGSLLVQAGGTIELGTSSGILTTANLQNNNLPAQGADVTVAAGITPTPDYSAFMSMVLDPAGLPPSADASYAAAYKYVQQLTDYMTAYEELPPGTLSDAQAYTDFKALPAATQLQFLQPLTREVFIDRYLDPAGPVTTYSNAAGNQTQTGGKYYGTDPSGNGKYLTDYMTNYESVTPGTLSDTQALADFRALPSLAQQAFILQSYYQELRLTGRAHSDDGYDYQRGLDVISALFPADNYKGDLNLYFSQIRTEAGGNINLLVPGGLVNAGLANPPAGLKKDASNLGIVAQGTGDVSAFVNGDFLVNQSRVFTLLGGNILIWSTEGNIDAGRGAKTAITVPPPTVTTNADGTTTFNFQGAATGSGIREILTNPDVKPGDVDLIAPKGEVNAGDAGIGAAGNLNIAAQQVVGADNIQVGGVSSGVPTSDSGALSAGLTGTSNLGGDSNKLANDVTRNLGEGDANGALAYLSVDVIGFGDCKSGDESCDQ